MAFYRIRQCGKKAVVQLIKAIGVLPVVGKRRYCNLCGHTAIYMRPYGIDSSLFNISKVIGGGVRKNCECIYCKSHDRFRWCYDVLQHDTRVLQAPCDVLHIAPEPQIAQKLEALLGERYVTGDLNPKRAKLRVDVTAMPFADATFDVIIMNHVLEHIPDEASAMRELIRCLKPDGVLLLSFPLCRDQVTQEDAAITDPQERLARYGQMDHCRLYGTDADERLRRYDLRVRRLSPKDRYTAAECKRLGLLPDDVIFFCQKQGV